MKKKVAKTATKPRTVSFEGGGDDVNTNAIVVPLATKTSSTATTISQIHNLPEGMKKDLKWTGAGILGVVPCAALKKKGDLGVSASCMEMPVVYTGVS